MLIVYINISNYLCVNCRIWWLESWSYIPNRLRWMYLTCIVSDRNVRLVKYKRLWESIFYPPQKKLREGNVFTPACQSFCSQGRRGFLYDVTSCLTETLMDRDLNGQRPPRQRPPEQRTPWTETSMDRDPRRLSFFGAASLHFI